MANPLDDARSRQLLHEAEEAASELRHALLPVSLHNHIDISGTDAALQNIQDLYSTFAVLQELLWDSPLRSAIKATPTSDAVESIDRVIRNQARYQRVLAPHCRELSVETLEAISGNLALMRRRCVEAMQEMILVRQKISSARPPQNDAGPGA